MKLIRSRETVVDLAVEDITPYFLATRKPGTNRNRSWISVNPEARIISRSMTVTGAGASRGD